MPLAHKLLSRLIACIPQGSATGNEIVVQACGLVSAFWGGLGITVQACGLLTLPPLSGAA